MRAAVYTGDRGFTTQERHDRRPAAGEVAIDVAFTGICGTDLHIFHGDMDGRVQRPAVIGHEMSGLVASVGSDVGGWSAGDHVTVMPLAWCGTCPACERGHRHICHHLDFMGIDSTGSMQQRWVVPASTLVALPVSLPLEHAALVEPTAVAVHDVGRAQVAPGERVLVVGGGPVGVLVALVARTRGATVLVAEPNAHRRAVAEGLGLAAVDPLTTSMSAVVDDWTAGAGADVTFEVSGAAAGVDLAVASLATRGRLVLVAIHAQPRTVDLHRFFWRELHLIGVRLYERTDFDQAIELLRSGAVPAAELISRVEGLEDVERAFAALEAGGPVMKVLIDCRSAS